MFFVLLFIRTADECWHDVLGHVIRYCRLLVLSLLYSADGIIDCPSTFDVFPYGLDILVEMKI